MYKQAETNCLDIPQVLANSTLYEFSAALCLVSYQTYSLKWKSNSQPSRLQSYTFMRLRRDSFTYILNIIFYSSYTGSNCQFRINMCDSSPCDNSATCHDHITYYTCHCPYGYTGKHCETFVDWQVSIFFIFFSASRCIPHTAEQAEMELIFRHFALYNLAFTGTRRAATGLD